MVKADLSLDEIFFQTNCITIFLFYAASMYDILRQVRGKTMEANFSPIKYQSGGEAIRTNFSLFEI